MKQKAIKSPALAAKRVKTAPQPAGRVLPSKLAAGPKVPTAPVNKQERCLDLLVRRDGATLSELVTATGWQPHSVRGFLSGTVTAIATGRAWLNQLIQGDVATIATIANREGRTERSVRMIVSLAFLAPDIVKAAIAGTLPRGLGGSDMTDLPMDWAEQRKHLGLYRTED